MRLLGVLVLLSLSVNSWPLLIASGQSQMTVTVTFDQPSYQQSGLVNISGKATDTSGQRVSGATVSLQVVDPSGSTKKADLLVTAADGSYNTQFRLAPDALIGVYTTFVVASRAGFTDAKTQNTFQVTAGSQTTTTATTTPASSSTTTGQHPRRGCIIATVAFGTAFSPEVLLLRTYRDQILMRTSVGAAFIMAYDQWYYSFSPQVSDAIALSPMLRGAVALALYPLLASLHIVSSQANDRANGEVNVLAVGVLSSMVLGSVYLSPISFGIYSLAGRGRGRVAKVKEVFLPVFASALITFVALALRSPMMLEIGVVTLAVSSATAGAMLLVATVRLIYLRRGTAGIRCSHLP